MNVSKPISLTAAQVRNCMRRIFAGEARNQSVSEIYFPSRAALSLKVPCQDLVTPWESSLQGLRIADFRGTGLRFLNRRDDQVTWSRPITGENFEKMLDQFIQMIEFRMRELDDLIEFPRDQKIIYEMDICTELLKGSFLPPKKVRLIPLLEWPSPEECVKAVKDVIPASPWERVDYSGRMVLRQEGSNLIFEDFGERGELIKTITSFDQNQFQWDLIGWFMRKWYFDEDRNFRFDFLALP